MAESRKDVLVAGGDSGSLVSCSGGAGGGAKLGAGRCGGGTDVRCAEIKRSGLGREFTGDDDGCCCCCCCWGDKLESTEWCEALPVLRLVEDPTDPRLEKDGRLATRFLALMTECAEVVRLLGCSSVVDCAGASDSAESCCCGPGTEGIGPLGGVGLLGIVTCLDLLFDPDTRRSGGSTEANVDTEYNDGARSLAGEPKELPVGAGLDGALMSVS
jgi:hypothetical protein